jgi:hypothetical protein
MTCRKINANLADLLFEPESVPAEVREHVTGCADCASELASLQAAMKVMEEWRAPEPGAFFDAKLFARLREEAAVPVGRWERLRAWMLYGNRIQARQWAAAALVAVLAIGGGTFAIIQHDQTPVVQQSSATIRDLQAYDSNAQLFQQLNALASSDDTPANAVN